jgi:hypothetical protein
MRFAEKGATPPKQVRHIGRRINLGENDGSRSESWIKVRMTHYVGRATPFAAGTSEKMLGKEVVIVAAPVPDLRNRDCGTPMDKGLQA